MFGMCHSLRDDADASAGEEDEVFNFVNEWLCAIADYSMGLLVVELLKVEKFSSQGREQVRVDLEYIRYLTSSSLINYCQ